MKYANAGKNSSMTRSKGANGMHVAMPPKPCVYGKGGMMNKKGGKSR